MSVEVSNETNWQLDPKLFSDLGIWTMRQLKVSTDSDLTITFVDPDPIATLHEKWMDLVGPTDVMSFPMDELRPATETDEEQEGILGDIVICPDVAARQAMAAGHSVVEEMMLLETHGILHLLGFDHIIREEERRMFALQRQLLLTFLAQRDGALGEVVLTPGSPDMLARYYRQHQQPGATRLVTRRVSGAAGQQPDEGDVSGDASLETGDH
ncbi:MAG: rRNA maturation RNase YbeY [Aeriscardovia sp.]|nr:rRNA maturation RNase YbeY [Aeriscardovia sp.]